MPVPGSPPEDGGIRRRTGRGRGAGAVRPQMPSGRRVDAAPLAARVEGDGRRDAQDARAFDRRLRHRAATVERLTAHPGKADPAFSHHVSKFLWFSAAASGLFQFPAVNQPFQQGECRVAARRGGDAEDPGPARGGNRRFQPKQPKPGPEFQAMPDTERSQPGRTQSGGC